MWRDKILALTRDASFSAPASDSDIDGVESVLGVAMPSELRELLLESNGVRGKYGLGLIWSVRQIEEENLSFRSNADFRELYMPFDHLLFFADAGNGDQFAFPIQDGAIRRPDIFAWNHETDGRIWVAPSLVTYLEWWIAGKIDL